MLVSDYQNSEKFQNLGTQLLTKNCRLLRYIYVLLPHQNIIKISKLRHQNIALNAFPALGEPNHCSQNLGLVGCYNWMTKHINSMISWFGHSKYMSNCLEEPNEIIQQPLNIIDNDLKNTHFSPLQKAGFGDLHKSSPGRPDITLDVLPMHI